MEQETQVTDISIINVNNVHGYIDKEGTAWLNAADVARGLGFIQTQKKNEKEYTSIRWVTVNEYLSGFGFPQQVGENDFLPENMFYRLAMKAKNEVAEKFQAKVADEILPRLRKEGGYFVKPMSTVDMFGLAYQALKEHEERLNQHDRQITEQTQRLDTQETRLAAIEEKVEDRVFPYPDRKKARQLSNRMYRICEARQKHDEENHPDQVYDIPRYIEHLKEEVIEQLNQATGRNVAREVQQAQTYYMKKYYEAKSRDKSPSSDILRPAAIRNLTQVSYISSDPDLYTQLELLLENYDYGGMDREE